MIRTRSRSSFSRPKSSLTTLAALGLIAIASGCRASEQRGGVAAGDDLQSAPTSPVERPAAIDPDGAAKEARLLDLLARYASRPDEDLRRDEVDLVVEALRFASARARTIPAETLRALVRHRSERLRVAAMAATQDLHRRDAIDRDAAVDIYWLAAFDPQSRSMRQYALSSLGEYDIEDPWTYRYLVRVARAADTMNAYIAHDALRRGGVDTGPLVVERLSQGSQGMRFERWAVRLLARSKWPGAKEALEDLTTNSSNAWVRELAQAQIDRQSDELLNPGVALAHRSLRTDLGWRPVTRARLAGLLASTRLALFAEPSLHKDAVRDAQKWAVDAFGVGGGELLIGFEPTRRVGTPGQQTVIDHAIPIGLEPISTEPGIESDPERDPADTTALTMLRLERDELAARTVLARLRDSAAARIFVMRRDSSLRPGGHLLNRIGGEAVSMLYSWNHVPLLVNDSRLELTGSVFASDTVDGLFAICHEPTPSVSPSRALRARLESPDGAGDR